MKRILKLLIMISANAFVLFCFLAISKAQEVVEIDLELVEVEENGAVVLDEVVVVGTLKEQLRNESPVPVELVTREDIEERGAKNLADVLTSQPGMEIVYSVGGTGVRMQGYDSDYVLILVDGQRVAGRINGVVDLNRYDVESVERIEILRGAGSALYGADAMAGVINIITREASAPLRIEGTAGYGQRNTYDSALRLELSNDKGQLWSNFAISGDDGFDLTPEDIFSTGSSFKEYRFGIGGDYQLTDITRIITRISYLSRRQHRVDGGASRAVFDRQNMFEEVQTSAGFEHRFLGGATWKTRLGYNLFRNQFFYDQRNSELESHQVV